MRLITAFLLFGSLLAFSGCTPPEDPMLNMIDIDLRKTKVDDLSKTMDLIFSDRRYDQQEFQTKVAGGLNRWVTSSADELQKVEWSSEPKVEELAKKFTGLSLLERTSDLSFVDDDAYFIQESAWVKQIVERVTTRTQLNAIELYRLTADDFRPDEDAADPVAEVVQRLHSDLSDDEAKKLAQAFTYFDWVVRNVQLLPTVDHSGDDLEDLRLNEQDDPAAAGVAGLGYQQHPWQTLLFARGDYVDRAKLFMVGLNQLGLDSVMLAVTDASSKELQPWVVAVVIGDEYFLFDTKMALPMPGEKLGSFATLAEVRKNPKLIDGLDLRVDESLEDDTDYWVASEQLKDLTGLIYVAPQAVTKRMKVLESKLLEDQALVLSQSPAAMEQRFPKTENFKLELWDTGFQTAQYRQAVNEALKDTNNNVLTERLRWYYDDEFYINSFTRYRTSRARFFGGIFETERNATGLNAIESFKGLIYTDQAIEDLATDPMLQERLGILKPKGSDEASNAADFNRQLSSVQNQMRLVRRDTGLFLAQSHFDNGSFSAAANWLKVLQSKEDAERWSDGVNYLLGRAYESRMEYDLAIEHYRKYPKSTQAHGNLIRARILSAAVKKVYSEARP